MKAVNQIPRDRVVRYARIVVDCWPQKRDPNRVRVTADGNPIAYPFEFTTRTADIMTSKSCGIPQPAPLGHAAWPQTQERFYLATPLDKPEYM